MSQPTLRQVGLTTLEEGSLAGVPYTSHWKQTYLSASEQLGCLDQAAAERICRLGGFVSHITDRVVRGNELEAVKGYKEFLQTENPTLGGALKAWDESLGSFNAMHDGQGDLLRAAGLLLQHYGVSEGQPPGVTESNPRNVYKSFVSLWNNTPVEHHQPKSQLFLAGQFVHKAAWLDTNPDRQARLFGIADTIYTQICERAVQWPTGKDLASEYRADIRFHLLSSQLRRANIANQPDQRDFAYAGLRNLMRSRARRFRKVFRQICEIEGDISGPAGHLFERFVSMAVRDQILTDWREGKDTLNFEVRQAFVNEDTTPRGMRPKPSFDKVVQFFHADGTVTTTPVQVKNVSKNGTHAPRSDYLPGLVYLRTTDLGLSQMYKAAAALERKYMAARITGTISDDNLRAVQSQYSGLLVA